MQPTSSTIQTLLNSNSNNPSLINPLFHNHGISSTTEQFNVHNNNPREIAEYQDDSEEDEKLSERRPLEPVQSTNTGKVNITMNFEKYLSQCQTLLIVDFFVEDFEVINISSTTVRWFIPNEK